MFEFFESKKTKLLKNHLRNLVALSSADGNIDDSEKDILIKIGTRKGLKKTEVEKIIENPGNTNFVPATSDDERFEQIYDLVELMLADGIAEDNELHFCVEMAEKLGFRKAVVGVLIRKITLSLLEGLDKETIKKEVRAFLVF
ncbi:MAG: TerB family tellurite resistance protein [Opitutaceae bacterium]|nr:TerB family tellurite resistance protein [Cytophagales bacterium]